MQMMTLYLQTISSDLRVAVIKKLKDWNGMERFHANFL